ncbi:aldehyde dehydrogenase family protein [uncultured Microbacterium sp.]|uniref:aldehyde dehydrogenase family protein n=1 Tax=uncultured Microbacterium sp. TaxID=191216 RepID=UPI00261B5607|nr:aldehyde dehydrogenase family protein [uncultured Microbacterium sp.]
MSDNGDVLTSYIDGAWAPSQGRATRVTSDPASGESVASYALADAGDVRRAVEAAARAAGGWARTTASERSDLVHDFLRLWEGRQDDLADIATREMGKVRAESYGETARVISESRFWAGEALRMGERTYPSTRTETDIRAVREPIGPVVAIAPWNFPILTPVRKVIPALVAGCPVILKPAMQAPGASVIIAELMHELGLPAGVFGLILGAGSEVGNLLVDAPEVKGITFTGSTAVGLAIGERAARRNARTQLEMGGKNAAIVAGVKDVSRAAREIVGAAFTASGQRCTAISRVIVTPDVRDELEAALVDQASSIVVGPGLEQGSTMGPVVDRPALENARAFVADAVKDGARVILGGDVDDRVGNFMAPTLVTDVAAGSPLAVEEVFAPVLAIVPVRDVDEALIVANETPYGLTASVFSDDTGVIHRATSSLRTGMVHVNHGTTSEGHVPFGGVGASGQGAFGIGDTSLDFFTTRKVIYTVNS